MSCSKLSTDEVADNEIYRLTPFGLLGPAITGAIIKAMKAHGDNALVFNGKDLEWARVEQAESAT